MSLNSYEIRLCESCGLRYPLMEGHPYGTRCPICMGNTRVILNRQLVFEPSHSSALDLHRIKRVQYSVLLDNVRSAWNVGSILRSADGFGFDHAYLCGITPTPENEAVRKTSLGAEDTVTWSYHKDAVKLVKGLKKEGWGIYALEENQQATSLRDEHWGTHTKQGTQKKILIVGNEITGVDPDLLELCDKIHFIPMHGEKKSFNVAIAFGIAAYALS